MQFRSTQPCSGHDARSWQLAAAATGAHGRGSGSVHITPHHSRQLARRAHSSGTDRFMCAPCPWSEHGVGSVKLARHAARHAPGCPLISEVRGWRARMRPSARGHRAPSAVDEAQAPAGVARTQCGAAIAAGTTGC